MSELSPKARALLARTSVAYDPSMADRDRLRRGLRARIAVGIAAGSGAATASGVAKAGPVGVLVKTLGLIVVAGSVGASAVALTRGSDFSQTMTSAPRATVTALASINAPPATPPATPSATLPPSPPAQVAPVVEASPVVPRAAKTMPLPAPALASAPARAALAPASPAAPASQTALASQTAPVSQPVPADDPLDAETALLGEAQAALRNHQGARALEALDTHARRFPTGVLAEERAAARVFALCELGRVGDGASAKASFLATYPVSPQAARVRNACARLPDK